MKFNSIQIIIVVITVLILACLATLPSMLGNKKLLPSTYSATTPIHIPFTSIKDPLNLSQMNSLYQCAALIYTGFSQTQGLETAELKPNYYYILDKENNNLHIFSPYFVGKSTLQVDKNKKPIVIETSNDAASGFQRLQYNILLPYLSPEIPATERGYYYLIINDSVFSGKHDPRINLTPPHFIQGEPQTSPTFSQFNAKGPFHFLDIGSAIWQKNSKQTVSQESATLFVRTLIDRLPNIYGTLAFNTGYGMPGLGSGLAPDGHLYRKEEIPGLIEPAFTKVIETCGAAAKETGIPELQQAVDIAKASKKL